MSLPSLKIGQQGLLMIVVILLLQSAFIGVNYFLLLQAEEESKQQEKTKAVIQRSSTLLVRMYTAGDKVGKYAFNKENDPSLGDKYLKEYVAARDEIPKIMSWLKDALKEQPRQLELLGKIQENVNVGIEILESMRMAADTKPQLEAVKFGIDQRVRLQPRIEDLVFDMKEFLSEEREIESRFPLLQQAQREQNKIVLVAGQILNLITVVIALFFVRGITKRLTIVIENSDRLRDGEALHEPLKGKDEVDMLDAAFHNMVASIRNEEAILRSSENSVLTLISQMPAGLVIIDGQAKVEFGNPALANLLNYDQDDLPGVPVWKLLTASGVGADSTYTWLKSNAEGRVVELSATKRNGKTLPVEVSFADVSSEENEHKLAMVLDVSERHEMEKLRQAFVAMVSHELRTPLSSVSMFLELLGMGVFGKTSEKIEKDLAVTAKQTEQVIVLINDLLDLEKLEAEKLELQKSVCEIEDLIDKAVEVVASAIESADILLLFEGAEDKVNVDSERIVQALSKLLSAVIHLTPKGDTLKIDATTSSGNVFINVNVATLLIPDEQVETMFERFQQIQLPNMQQGTWLGLGLALSRAIIQQHGGDISLTSTEESGTTFLLQIPV